MATHSILKNEGTPPPSKTRRGATFSNVTNCAPGPTSASRVHSQQTEVRRRMASINVQEEEKTGIKAGFKAVGKRLSEVPHKTRRIRLFKKKKKVSSDYYMNPVRTTPPNSTDENDLGTSNSKAHRVSFKAREDPYETRRPGSANRRIRKASDRRKWEEKLLKVKPSGSYPSSMLMTEKELYEEMLKPSAVFHPCESALLSSIPKSKTDNGNAVDCKACQASDVYDRDNRIGGLRVEVLGCVGLPQFDRFSKPDIAVYLICGDSAFCTDIIPSCYSPLWPCESNRAAFFPIYHAYARLYVGVFAISQNISRNDDYVGRVSLDLASLKPNTQYDVTFSLRECAIVYNRRPRGVIRLRFHLHWCNERAAVLSYLKKPSSLGRVQVSCADAKTFRNVALTVYGKHLPGKFHHQTYRATVRECLLYEVQIKYLCIILAKELFFWDRPFLSCYLFSAWMISVYNSSISLIPSASAGFLALLLLNNYQYFTHNDKYHSGYSSLSLTELFLSLLIGAENQKAEAPAMLPLNIEKKIAGPTSQDPLKEPDDDLVDHMEFPFSEKNCYKRLSVNEAMFPRKKTNKEKAMTERKMNRLSIYQMKLPEDGEESMDISMNSAASTHIADDDEDEETTAGNDDDDFSSDSDAEDEMPSEVAKTTFLCTSLKSIPLGPVQDSGIITRGTPLKKSIRKIENKIHKYSFNLFRDEICDESALTDEFDRFLGLKARSSNPITRLKEDYTGPVMRIMNIVLVIVRIVFNIFTWKDPILSFWFLAFFIGLASILAILPWRAIMLLLGLVSLGPQNIVMKKIIVKKLRSNDNNNAIKTNGGQEKYRREDSEERKKYVEVFSGTLSASALKAYKTKPRSIVVPYSALRKERFYDWPPGPMVSRATPINLSQGMQIDATTIIANDDTAKSWMKMKAASKRELTLE